MFEANRLTKNAIAAAVCSRWRCLRTSSVPPSIRFSSRSLFMAHKKGLSVFANHGDSRMRRITADIVFLIDAGGTVINLFHLCVQECILLTVVAPKGINDDGKNLLVMLSCRSKNFDLNQTNQNHTKQQRERSRHG